jgi:caa(3)-type oxidase subunit IV
MRTLSTLAIGAVLLGLTTLSFLLSRADLSGAAVPVALGIAVVKVAAIGWFYMHLKEQPTGSRLTVAVACSLMAVLIIIVLLEAADRGTLANVPGPFLAR